MLVVQEQDGVDRSELARLERRPLGLRQHARADRVGAPRVEGRVGQDADAADLDEHARAAEVLDVHS
jgi:hypothetical protein